MQKQKIPVMTVSSNYLTNGVDCKAGQTTRKTTKSDKEVPGFT